MALLAQMRGKFVSHHTETWGEGEKAGRRDTVYVCDPSDGMVLECSFPRDRRQAGALVDECRAFKWGDDVLVAVEQRNFSNVGSARVDALYVLHDIEKAGPASSGITPPATQKAS